MTREELWAVYTAKSPKLSGNGNDVINIRLRGLKKMFDEAWAQAEEQAYAEISRDVRGSSDMPEFMKDLFRK